MKATRPENNPTFPATNQNENLAGDSRMSKVLNPIVIGSKSRVKLTALPRGSSLRKHEALPKLIATRQQNESNRGRDSRYASSASKESPANPEPRCPCTSAK